MFAFVLVLAAFTPAPEPGQGVVVQVQSVGNALPASPSPCAPVPSGQASYSHAVALWTGQLIQCEAFQSGPWSAAYSPDGDWLYVSLMGGGIGSDNCVVARLDAETHQVLGTIPVGRGPEEIAFTRRAGAGFRRGFVTNSSDSSVTVFNQQHQVVATIPIPFDSGAPFPTAFPFGLAVSPDQTRVYVGTLDGSGKVYAIDAAALVLLPGETIDLGRNYGTGRMLFAGSTLVIPATLFHPSFQGSTAKVFFAEPGSPSAMVSIELASSPDAGAFPSPQDVGLLCENKVYVAGFDMGARVFVLDAKTRSLMYAIPTQTSEPLGKFQALGVSKSGLIAVADLWTEEIAFINGWSDTWMSTLQTGFLPDFHSQLNEIAFSRDGEEMVLPGRASDSLAVFDVQ